MNPGNWDPFLLYSNAVLLVVGPTSLKLAALTEGGQYIGKVWTGSVVMEHEHTSPEPQTIIYFHHNNSPDD